MPKRLVQYCRIADSFESSFTTKQFAESATLSHSNATSALNSLKDNGWIAKREVLREGFHGVAYWECLFEEFVIGYDVALATPMPERLGRLTSTQLLSLLSNNQGWHDVISLCASLGKERRDMTDALDRLLEDDMIVRVRPPHGCGIRRNGWLYRSRFRARS